MLTFTYTIKRTTKQTILSRSGFTLIEILIALALMSLVFSFALNYSFTSRQLLEQESKKIERALNYVSDESSLRNKVIRLKFNLEELPQTFTIEYGPDENFVLPAKKYPEKETLTKDQIEKVEAELKKIDRNFLPITDINDENLQIDEGIQVLGIGIPEDQKIIFDFYPSVHFYPSGEKDAVIIFLATNEEIIAIVLSPFVMDIEKIYTKLEYNEYDEIDDVKYNTMVSIFEEYMK
jgi:prepilin-type N-terminal cleavage/methylation domain-containing protein